MKKNLWLWIVLGAMGLIVLIGIVAKIGSWVEGGVASGNEQALNGPYAYLIIDAGSGMSHETHSLGFPGRPFPNADEVKRASVAGSEPTVVPRKIFNFDVTITVWGADGVVNTEAANRTLDHIDDIGTALLADNDRNEVAQINRGAGHDAVAVSEMTLAVVKRALLVAELSGGVYDPTMGPLTRLWSQTLETQQLPAPDQIEAARKLVGYKFVEIDESARTVKLANPGMELDLTAAARGYLADEAARYLHSEGAEAGVVAFDSDVVAFGHKPDGSAFHVFIDNPFSPGGAPQGIVEGTDFSVVTLGNYQRYVVIDRQRYSQFVDPRTGQSVIGAASCTVTGPDALTCEALAWAVAVGGDTTGRTLIQKMNGWVREHPAKH